MTGLEHLHPDKRNARKHNPRNLGMIEQSLQEVGTARSIVVDEDGNILAGNGTHEVATRLGMKLQIVESDGETLIAVRRRNLTPEQKQRLALFDNRTAETAEWDTDVLGEILAADHGALAGMFTTDELADLVEQVLATPGDGGDDFDTTPADGPTRVQRGDLWLLGEHRLLCGDSTNTDDVARLMNGERASICFTSPPYNAGDSESLSGNTHTKNTKYVLGGNDALSTDDYGVLLYGFTRAALGHCDYVFVNVQPLAGNKVAVIEYQFALRDHFADVAIWNKGHAAPLLAQRVVNSQFEYILVFSSNQYPSRAIGTRDFRGTVPNVYDGPPNRNNEFASVHAATFPLHFPTWGIETFSNPNEVIYEPFCGTGTTLIAAHRTGRRCYGIEIEPKYCDVILRRWEAETGQTAQRGDDGRT